MRRASFGVVIAAAGSGSRYGAAKQFLSLAGEPLVVHSLRAFASLSFVGEIVVVGPAGELERLEEIVRGWSGIRREPTPRVEVVAGGARRQDSVRIGIDRFSPAIDRVLVHDAARPLIEPEEIERVAHAIETYGAAAIGHPASDSIHEVARGDGGAVDETPRVVRRLDREQVWQVQTPQGSRRELIERAYETGALAEATDEVSLLVASGVEVRLVRGSVENLKITLPGDLERAELILARRRSRKDA